LAIEYRWAEGHNDRLPALAADLVHRQVNVIAAPGSTPAALAAKSATSTIPIIFWVGGDPIELGLVTSMNRPESNLTGLTTLNHGLVAKRMELLHEAVPWMKSVAVLVNPTSPTLTKTTIEDAQAAARSLALGLHIVNASTETDLDEAFAKLIQLQVGGLVVGTDAFFSGRLEQLAALSVRYAVPSVYQFREFAAVGGLIGYGGSLAEAFRGTGVYSGRILKGDKPGDLPVQQVTKLELYINLKTAKALGLDFPIPLVGRANEVIE
jgi:putative ABC transport system substrate-binding protein